MFTKNFTTLAAALAVGSALVMTSIGSSQARDGGNDGPSASPIEQFNDCNELRRKIRKTQSRLKSAKSDFSKARHKKNLQKYRQELEDNC